MREVYLSILVYIQLLAQALSLFIILHEINTTSGILYSETLYRFASIGVGIDGNNYTQQ